MWKSACGAYYNRWLMQAKTWSSNLNSFCEVVHSEDSHMGLQDSDLFESAGFLVELRTE